VPEPAPVPQATQRAGNYTSAIYGTIVVAGVIAALGHEHAAASTVFGSVLATSFVFWLAHVWAAATSARVEAGRRLPPRAVAEIAAHEWPMVESAVLPLVPIALAWAGLCSDATGIDLALAVAVLQLVGWGLVVGRRTYERWPAVLLSGVVNGALGVLLVVLKALVH
jgi:hypothetical protein